MRSTAVATTRIRSGATTTLRDALQLGRVKQYSCGGFAVESEIALPLPPAVHRTGVPDLTISISSRPLAASGTYIRDLAASDNVSGGVYFAEDSLLYVCGTTRILCRSSDHTISFSFEDRNAALHLLTDLVIPEWFSRSALVLHASSVAIGEIAVAFVGASGTGKSTLALAVPLHSEKGAMIADDYLVIREEDRVAPTAIAARVWPDSAEQAQKATVSDLPTGKKQVDAGGSPLPAPVKLSRLFVLAESDEVEISPVTKRDAFAQLFRNAFRIDPADPLTNRETVNRISDLLNRLPLYQLSYPRSYSALPHVADLLRQHLHAED